MAIVPISPAGRGLPSASVMRTCITLCAGPAEATATIVHRVLAELSEHLSKVVPGVEAGALRHVLEERELLASTAIGDGIAIRHMMNLCLSFACACGRS